MKKIIITSLLVLCCGFSTGCETLVGAAIGGAIDKNVLNGDGKVGAVVGASLVEIYRQKRQEREATPDENGNIKLRCENAYAYSTRKGRAEYAKVCSGRSIETMQASGFPNAPVPSYGPGVTVKDDGPKVAPCVRYKPDGINKDCKS